MRWIDHGRPVPAENLALDEALLNRVEDGAEEEVLRFWESAVPFVVLGVSQRWAEHVREATCSADGVPVLRRCSAGGCVLQGPGCLNFALVMRQDRLPDISSPRRSYRYILERIACVLRGHGVKVAHEGICDLAVDGIKVSGNAQKRRRRAILHHGTLLHRMDATALTRYLLEPADRPGYRGVRTHEQFVGALKLSPATLKDVVRDAFGCTGEPDGPSADALAEMMRLVRDKYALDEWNRRR